MKQFLSVVGVTLLFAILTAYPVFAEEEIVGRVLSMTGTALVVRADNGETRHLDVTPQTRYFVDGAPAHLNRILPHSLVRITPKDGRAEAISILEVPR